MERIHGHLYDYPRYYDLVFGSDWKAEFDFLIACFDKHTSRPVKRLFEPACGTGRLLYRFERADFDVVGLDLNEHAVDYCNQRLARQGLPESAIVGDMTDFRLRPAVDASFNTINSFRHLQTEKQAQAHLACMSDATRKGGIYVVGLHLTPTRGVPVEEESWSASRGHLTVNTHMWLLDRQLADRTERYGMTFDIHTPTRAFQLYDEIVFRTYTEAQFRSLVQSVPSWEIAETYDFSYDINKSIAIQPSTEDVLFVLKKR